MFQTLIASANANSGAVASFEFTSIPQTYTDLVLVVSARYVSTGTDFVLVQLNGTTTGYTWRNLQGDSSTVNSYTQTSIGGLTMGMFASFVGGTSYTANTFNSCQMLIPNYTGSTTKTASSEGVFENNSTVANQTIVASSSSVTAAVTSLTVKIFSGNLAQYSTAYLYGTLKGSGGASVS
jgi:hypothetical protein